MERAMRARIWVATVLIPVLAFAACSGSSEAGLGTDLSASDPPTSAAGSDTAADQGADAVADAGTDADEAESTAPADSAASVGGAGTIVLGDENITFDSARCFLQEQDAAAGGGKILFVVQAYGANSAGEELYIDVSRYDQDSQFSGDKIELVVGDPYSGNALSWEANDVVGTVALDGSTASAGSLTFRNGDDGTTLPGSFEVHC